MIHWNGLERQGRVYGSFAASPVSDRRSKAGTTGNGWEAVALTRRHAELVSVSIPPQAAQLPVETCILKQVQDDGIGV